MVKFGGRPLSKFLRVRLRVFRIEFRSEQRFERTREACGGGRVPMDLISNRADGLEEGWKGRNVAQNVSARPPLSPTRSNYTLKLRFDSNAIVELVRFVDRRSFHRHLCFTLQQSSIVVVVVVFQTGLGDRANSPRFLFFHSLSLSLYFSFARERERKMVDRR